MFRVRDVTPKEERTPAQKYLRHRILIDSPTFKYSSNISACLPGSKLSDGTSTLLQRRETLSTGCIRTKLEVFNTGRQCVDNMQKQAFWHAKTTLKVICWKPWLVGKIVTHEPFVGSLPVTRGLAVIGSHWSRRRAGGNDDIGFIGSTILLIVFMFFALRFRKNHVRIHSWI